MIFHNISHCFRCGNLDSSPSSHSLLLTIMTDREEQDDELLALSEILDPSNFKHSSNLLIIVVNVYILSILVSDENGLNTGEMTVHVSVDGYTGVAIKTGDDDQDQFHVHHLPPLTLQFTLPAEYPSQCQPSLSLSCPWLHHNHIEKLGHHLNQLYLEQGGGVILFSWLSFLQEEMLVFLDMETVINVSDLYDKHDNVGVYDTITASDIRDGLTVIDDDDDDDCQASGSTKVAEITNRNYDKTDTEKIKVEDMTKKEVVSDQCENESRNGEDARDDLKDNVKIGIVKKYKQIDDFHGHGIIREAENGREWSFHFNDCINNREYQGFVLFKKGDKVSFKEKYQRGNVKHNHKQTTPRAFNVAYYDGDFRRQNNEIVDDIRNIQLNGVDKKLASNENKRHQEPDKVDVKVSSQEETANVNKTAPSKVDNNIQRQRIKKKSRRQILITLLREFNQMKEEEVFSSSLNSCEICYVDKVKILLFVDELI